MDSEMKYTIFAIILIIIVGILLPLYFLLKPLIFNGNRDIFDTEYNFNKCITIIGNEKFEIDIESWIDYEGGQLQVKDKEGNVYLLSSFNTILIKEVK